MDPPFIFQPPLVWPVNVLNPFIDTAGTLDWRTPLVPWPLSGLFTQLFVTLFENLPSSVRTTTVRVRLGVDYSYRLGGLPVSVPMFLTIPYDYNKTGDPAFVSSISERTKEWFSSRNIIPSDDNSLVVDLTIFSSESATQLPILRLRAINIPCGAVDWN